jgi:hypothetical protein
VIALQQTTIVRRGWAADKHSRGSLRLGRAPLSAGQFGVCRRAGRAWALGTHVAITPSCVCMLSHRPPAPLPGRSAGGRDGCAGRIAEVSISRALPASVVGHPQEQPDYGPADPQAHPSHAVRLGLLCVSLVLHAVGGALFKAGRKVDHLPPVEKCPTPWRRGSPVFASAAHDGDDLLYPRRVDWVAPPVARWATDAIARHSHRRTTTTSGIQQPRARRGAPPKP